MKKIVIVAVVVILLSGIFGCDGNNSSSSSGSTLRPYLENGIYQINVSVDLKLSESIPDLPEFDTWLYGKMTLTKMEITDKYTRVYSSISVDSSSGFYFLGAPTEDDYLIDNLKNKYKASSYGESYKTFQFIERDRTYLGYVEYKGRPPYSGVDSFKYYMTGLEKPIQFSIKVPLIAVVEEASTPTEDLKQQLAEKFAPVLWLHPDEVYEPKEVGIMVENADLRIKPSMYKVSFLNGLTAVNLYSIPDSEDYYLDLFPILIKGADSYIEKYKELKERYQITVYARVVEDKESRKIIIQYWFFYFFNNGPINIHEGDWELIQIILNNSGNPETVSFSQHGLAATKNWSEMVYLYGRPNVYVAKGSHANYLYSDENHPLLDETWKSGEKENIIVPAFDANLLKVLEETSMGEIKNYQLILLPEINEEKRIEKEAPWLAFKGGWGEWLPEPLGWALSGPISPITQPAWKKPIIWAAD